MSVDKKILFEKFNHDVEKRSRLKRFLLAIDQLFNVVLWNGSQDETISSHIHRKQLAQTATWFDNIICKCLRKIASKHCLRSAGE